MAIGQRHLRSSTEFAYKLAAQPNAERKLFRRRRGAHQGRHERELSSVEPYVSEAQGAAKLFSLKNRVNNATLEHLNKQTNTYLLTKKI
jgi:hypothetical protein